MSLITKAPPAAPIVLNSAVVQLFMAAGINNPGVCFLPIPGSSGLDLTLLDVTATGWVKPNQAGELEIGLFAYVSEPNIPPPTGLPGTGVWKLLGSCTPEPIGGAGDPAVTSWMIQGAELMFNLQNGKMQGTFKTNVADTPIAAANIINNPIGINGQLNPLLIFAVGARFTPTADDGHKPDLEMIHFSLSGEV